MTAWLVLLPFLLLFGIFVMGAFGFALSGRRLCRPDGSTVTGWLVGLGLGAGLLVGLMVLLVGIRMKASISSDARVTPPVTVHASEAPVIPMHWQQPEPPMPPPPPRLAMSTGVAFAPIALLGVVVLCLLIASVVLLAVRPQVRGFTRGNWGPVLAVSLLMLLGAGLLMASITTLRIDAGPPTGSPTWARLALLAGIFVVPAAVGLAAAIFHSLRPPTGARDAGHGHDEVSHHVPAWRFGLNGVALAVLPAGAVWGGSLFALQASPQEAIDAFGTLVLGIPTAAEQVRQASLVGKERLPAPTEDRSEGSKDLPEWIRTAEVHSGSRQRLILASRLYTSVAEAEHELLQEMTSLVRDDLRKSLPLARQATLAEVSGDTLQTLVVTKQYTQSEKKDFGNFEADMQRVWWEVQIDDQTRDRLATYVRHEVARGRLLVGVWGLALTTLIVGCYLALIQPRQLTSSELPASLMTA